MTVENCIKFLKIYEEKAKKESLPSHIRKQSQKNYDNMKEHILSARKFKDHPILKELEEKPKEIKKDGKKSKG